MYDFDTLPPRRGTGSLKWDKLPDLAPYWVADMDFVSAPEVVEAIQGRVSHGVFGYALPHRGLEEAVEHYLEGRLAVKAGGESIVHLGGIVPALSLAVRAFCEQGEEVLTCTPVYPPFLGVHRDGGANLITVPHVEVDGCWTFDWEQLEASVTKRTRVFLLSNPQNPLGRVFTREELEKLANFCLRHDLILVSDEIHCDLVLEEEKTPHITALSLPEELRNITITLLAPSKTYNIAGLGYSFAVIPDEKVRRRFVAAKGHTLAEINALAYYAAEAAYRHGEAWRQELLAYLRGNCELLVSYLAEHLPAVRVPKIEATYLAWMDCRGLGLEGSPADMAQSKAQVFLSEGAFFGEAGCTRFNFACPRAHLQEGLVKVVSAFS